MQAMSQNGAQHSHAFVKPVFVVNTNSPLMTALPKLNQTDPELAKEVVQEVYDLSLLSQREMGKEALNEFINRSHRILEKFTQGRTHES